jgi:4-diphosphocytidyl-2-C-methyl-D-erythritol kinase
MVVVECAPAKINIGLKILRKRSDGFHEILSLFQTVDLCDELIVSDKDKPGLTCDVASVPVGPDNLVLRAEQAFRSVGGKGKPARFSLLKRIPMSAGLGGGSADAAAALRGLKQLPGNDAVTDEMLSSCAAELGSDVPFLLTGGTAVVRGRGESVTRIGWPFDFSYVIVFPGFGISTAWAYGQVRYFHPDGGAYGVMLERIGGGSVGEEEVFPVLENDFEEVVFPEYPVLPQIKRELLDAGAGAAFLTGSGSSLVGVFRDREDASMCAESFRGRGMKAWVTKATPQNRGNA